MIKDNYKDVAYYKIKETKTEVEDSEIQTQHDFIIEMPISCWTRVSNSLDTKTLKAMEPVIKSQLRENIEEVINNIIKAINKKGDKT